MKNDYIDEFDLRRIINKIDELEQIVNWLTLLKTTNSSVDPSKINKTIKSIQFKIDKLNKKYNKAQTDMIEEAMMLAAVYR